MLLVDPQDLTRQIDLNIGTQFGRKIVDFAYSRADHTGYFGGWGSGKTVAGVVFLAACVETSPPNSAHVAIFPTYSMLKQWLIEAALPILGGSVLRYDGGSNTLLMRDGKRIVCMSGHEPTKIQATNASSVYMDEAHLMSEGVWHHAIARARKKGSKIRVGLTSLPKLGWLSDKFNGKNDASYRAMHVRTEDNPYVDAGYVERLKRGCPKRMWPAYLEGQFVATGGVVYPEFERNRHIIPWPATAGARRPVIGLGTDISMRRPHVIWFERVPVGTLMPGGWLTDREVSVAVDEIYPDGEYRAWTIERLAEAIKRRSRETGYIPSEVIIDPAGLQRGLHASGPGVNQSTVTMLQEALQIPIGYRTGERVRVGIQHVQLALDPSVGHSYLFFSDKLLEPKDDELTLYTQRSRSVIPSLEAYSYEEDRRGRLADEPFHDDLASHACDALRYWVRHSYAMDLGRIQSLGSKDEIVKRRYAC